MPPKFFSGRVRAATLPEEALQSANVASVWPGFGTGPEGAVQQPHVMPPPCVVPHENSVSVHSAPVMGSPASSGQESGHDNPNAHVRAGVVATTATEPASCFKPVRAPMEHSPLRHPTVRVVPPPSLLPVNDSQQAALLTAPNTAMMPPTSKEQETPVTIHSTCFTPRVVPPPAMVQEAPVTVHSTCSTPRVVPPPALVPGKNLPHRHTSRTMDTGITSDKSASSSTQQAGHPSGSTPFSYAQQMHGAPACSAAKRQVALAQDLRERLVKRRRTEDLERPPGNFDAPPGDCGTITGRLPSLGPPCHLERPPGNFDEPTTRTHLHEQDLNKCKRDRDRDRQDRGRRRGNLTRDKDRHHDGTRGKVRYADHCRSLRRSAKRSDHEEHGLVDKKQDGPTVLDKGPGADVLDAACAEESSVTTAAKGAAGAAVAASRTGLVNAPWRVNADACTSDLSGPGLATPKHPAEFSEVLTPNVQAPWRKAGQSGTDSGQHGLQPELFSVAAAAGSPGTDSLFTQARENFEKGLDIGDLMNEIDKVTRKPDIEELLKAVDQVAPEIIPSSPENVDDFSGTEESGTEDTDYDPFDAGSDDDPLAQQGAEDEDAGIVEALFEMMRSVEEVPPDPSMPVSESDHVSSSVASVPAESFETLHEPGREPTAAPQAVRPEDVQEEEEVQQKPSSAYKFNPKTQRWEPKRESATSETKAIPSQIPDKKAVPIATIDLIGDEDAPKARPHKEPKARPQKNYDIADCEAQARSDAAGGLVNFAQALAVRLVLRFESRPADMLKTMEEAGLPAAKDQRSTVKAIMRLCHPDKCKHSLAKRAMQALVPLLA